MVNQLTQPSFSYACAQRGLRHVFIRELKLLASIGIHPHERDQKQMIAIDVNVAVKEHGVSPSQISEVVCYETLCRQIKDLVNAGHIELVETLAEDIACTILRDHRILMVRVSIEKPEAIAEAAAVGVEIERHQR